MGQLIQNAWTKILYHKFDLMGIGGGSISATVPALDDLNQYFKIASGAGGLILLFLSCWLKYLQIKKEQGSESIWQKYFKK